MGTECYKHGINIKYFDVNTGAEIKFDNPINIDIDGVSREAYEGLTLDACRKRFQRYKELQEEIFVTGRLPEFTGEDVWLIEFAIRRSFGIECLNIADLEEKAAL